MEWAVPDTLRFAVDLTNEELRVLPPPEKWVSIGDESGEVASTHRFGVRFTMEKNYPSWLQGVQCALLGYKTLIVEYSAHKLQMGVNGLKINRKNRYGLWCLNGLVKAMRVLGLRIKLDRWRIQRIDIGILFHFPMWSEFCASAQRGYFPRRELKTEATSVSCGMHKGSTTRTAGKFYHKQTEQMVKNHCTCPPWMNKDLYLREIKDVMRFEVGFRKKWLRANGIEKISDITVRKYITAVRHMRKILFGMVGMVKPCNMTLGDIDLKLSRRPALRNFRLDYIGKGHKVLLEIFKAKKQENRFYEYLRDLRAMNIPMIALPEQIATLEVRSWEFQEVA